MRIIIMGPPGVGKGTEAELLIKDFNIPHISTGNIFRELYRDKTTVGKIAKSYIDKGELVPDDITNEIVRNRLSKPDVEKGFLFDGYPRNIEQAEAFDRILDEKGWKLNAVINIQTSDELIIKRISGRRVCEDCGSIYHLENNPPEIDGVCDKCDGNLIQRDDDSQETVLRRLRIYYDQTEPVIGYYKHSGIMINADGSNAISKNHADIMKALGEMN
ncbi:adenylate kinase [Mariniplasma anaerobium]|uniref:Adenylate kinase n=1 Tax=Mariniplasma anaerobium TaxID=2735436 RepID=A0A7U9XW54_9MOLU|nr:adenylate kinase [Mariniplasma anaerobium]BCR35350.1 adenylate kinase [Mariniplasma anaerobium]